MSDGINPKLNIKDRVVILHMSEDPATVPIGTHGTVTGISETPWGIQYTVRWDNGSTLDILPDVDFWKKEKKEVNENRLDDLKKKKDILKPFDYFDNPDLILDFLFKLQDSGITNMLEASSFLTMDENHLRRWLIGRYSDEEIEENYQDLLNATNPMRYELIAGLIKYVQDNGKDPNDLDLVNLEFIKFIRLIVNAYLNSYSLLKRRHSNLKGLS